MNIKIKSMTLLTTLLFLSINTGCLLSRKHDPPIQEIYRQAAKIETRNPVIVIHGVLGARLTKRSTGKVVWGAFTSQFVSPKTNEGARSIALPLDIPTQTAYDPQSQDVYADGPLGQLQLGLTFPIISVNVYRNILRALGAGGYTDPVGVDPRSPIYSQDHYTCYTFFYDWRRDNVSNAFLLADFIQKKRIEINRAVKIKINRLEQQGDPKSLSRAKALSIWLHKGYKFDIVAHSMGGLIARYYMRYGSQDLLVDGLTPELNWAGSKEVDRLILIATPSFGSIQAFDNLVNGRQEAKILPVYHQALLGTMPAIYQLLPRQRHNLVLDQQGQPMDLDLFDSRHWRDNGWGLMSDASDDYLKKLLPNTLSREKRYQIAYAYLDWCLRRASQFHRALDVEPQAPSPSQIYLYAGDVEPTATRVRLIQRHGKLVPQFNQSDLLTPGDGTVPRYSALGDNRFGNDFQVGLRSPINWTNVTFLSDNHLGLTKNLNFVNNVLFVLLEQL